MFVKLIAMLFTLNRIAVFGAARSTSISGHLATGVVSLWMVECLAVWAALAPAGANPGHQRGLDRYVSITG